MAKTRRSTKKMSSTRKHKFGKYEVTYTGLRKWYTHMFEHLGWMVLAQKHGIRDKIATYKHSLVRLERALKHKIHEIHDIDKKHDLEIMLDNLQCLIDHARKDFH